MWQYLVFGESMEILFAYIFWLIIVMSYDLVHFMNAIFKFENFIIRGKIISNKDNDFVFRIWIEFKFFD